jgi:glycosyltransferase involved in cell wall biosynthesis
MSLKLSIITVNLNNKEGLRKTIESVIDQSFCNYEYIIIDGASDDGSVEIIQQYADKIDYWVSEPDTGIYNAMNKGILKAQGEYCLFLNSGDGLLQKNTLSELFACTFAEDIVYGNNVILSESPIRIDRGLGKSIVGLYDLATGRINHQACLIKRNLFTTFGLYSENYRIVSDWKFFIDSIIFGNASVRYIDKNISFFDVEGISSLNKNRAHEETMEILNSTFPPRILSDIKELDRYKRSKVVQCYDKLIQNELLLKIYNFLFHGKTK